MIKILCVDDAASVRALVRGVLAADGIEVITAASGAEGLELMVSEAPDAVLLDIIMPIMDGLEALRRISENADLARVPVMIVTSISDAQKVRDALTLGARDYIVKPFDPQVLRQRVRRLLETRGRAAPAGGDGASHQSLGATPDLRVAKKLLVVDDQPTILAIVQEFIGERYEVFTARSGAGALALAVKERPDLILMDIHMPVMDGVEARRRLRQIPELADTRVLALTLGTVAEEGFLAEFDGAIRKPLDRNDLLQAVGAVLGLPGLFTFSTRGELSILQLYNSKLWHLTKLDELHQQVERGFAQMLETGRTWFVIDVEQLVGLEEPQIAAVVEAVRSVVRRANECRLDSKLVVPYQLRPYFAHFPQELGIEVCRQVDDALHSLQRRANRFHPGRRSPAG